MPKDKLREVLSRFDDVIYGPRDRGRRNAFSPFDPPLDLARTSRADTGGLATAENQTLEKSGAQPEGDLGDEAEIRAFQRVMDDLTRSVEELRRTSAQQTGTLESNTKALVASTLVQQDTATNDRRGTLERVGGALSASMFSVSPLIGSLLRLFGGRRPESLAPPELFELPPPRTLVGGLQEGRPGEIVPVSLGQGDLPRRVPESGAGTAPQVTIQIQAIDSRSFLDHSEDIARAVRQAMLRGNELNDAVMEI